MNAKLIDLALKKQRLQLQSAALRDALAENAGNYKSAFALADRMSRGAAWLRRHPALPVAALVTVLVARPRAVLRLAGRGWLLWGTVKQLRATAESVLAHVPRGTGVSAGSR